MYKRVTDLCASMPTKQPAYTITVFFHARATLGQDFDSVNRKGIGPSAILLVARAPASAAVRLKGLHFCSGRLRTRRESARALLSLFRRLQNDWFPAEPVARHVVITCATRGPGAAERSADPVAGGALPGPPPKMAAAAALFLDTWRAIGFRQPSNGSSCQLPLHLDQACHSRLRLFTFFARMGLLPLAFPDWRQADTTADDAGGALRDGGHGLPGTGGISAQKHRLRLQDRRTQRGQHGGFGKSSETDPPYFARRFTPRAFSEVAKESQTFPCGQVFGVGLQQVVQSDRQRFPNSTLAQPAPWSAWDNDPGVAAADALSLRSDNACKSFLSSLADFSKESSRKDSVEHPRQRSSTANSRDDDCLTVHGPLVPRVVNCCLKYLEDNGLNTVGIFRVNGLKRRVRQLREEFDSCREVNLDQERPHDVAQLLKEYLRDLPEPLLTRDLYHPFLYTQRVLEKRNQLDILQQLVRLLPAHSRETLWALLEFLKTVAKNSVDKKSSSGQHLPGNKMDAHNLATMLGPNVLRLSENSEKEKFIVENHERAEEHGEVILVVRQLIENYEELFRVSAEDLDSLYKRLLINSPDHLESLLRRRLNCAPGSQDEDASDDNF
ncbi:hypothetical protein MRX96_058503 [Rhipicephalus microplus]